MMSMLHIQFRKELHSQYLSVQLGHEIMISGQANNAESASCVLTPLPHVSPVDGVVVSPVQSKNWNV